jgi:Flp pilus assembly protein TadG
MDYHACLTYLRATMSTHRVRLRTALRDRDRGASAVELAIITALMLVVAGGVVAAITVFTNNANTKIQGTQP